MTNMDALCKFMFIVIETIVNIEHEEKEIERGVCACWESKTFRSRGSTSDSRRLNKVWSAFF